MKKAIFPGSFDPITLGHVDIINRGVTLFDEVIIAIGENSTKNYMFSLDERIAFIERAFKDNPKVRVMSYMEGIRAMELDIVCFGKVIGGGLPGIFV